MTFIEIILLSLGYVVIGSVVGAVSFRTGGDDEDSFFIGAFWPASLPLIATLLTVAGIVTLVQKARVPKFLSRKSAEQKVIEYSEAPTKILAEIIASKIVAAPELLNRGSERWISEDKKINVWYHSYSREISSVDELKVNDKALTLPKECNQVIVKALNHALKIQTERAAADAEAKKQLDALEAVESLLLKPEKE